MRRYLPALLLSLSALSPLALLTGCGDLLEKWKGGGDDAGADAAVVALPPATATATAPIPTDTTTTTAVTPLTTTTAVVTATAAPTTTVRPADAGPIVDAGSSPTDAGAVKTDGGAVPAPTLNIPNLFDAGNASDLLKGFDAGGLKLPTFPK